MAVAYEEKIMEPGSWSVDVDWSAALYAELVDDDHRPRKHHVTFRDPASTLIYTGVVLRVSGDEEGLTIGGSGMLWHLGAGDVGPMIADREYVSGTNKLSNGSFDLDDLYWRLPSQGSLWDFSGGNATKVGSLAVDDVLESDEKFPTRPGYSYRATASGVTGTGKLRMRTLYEGNFAPPNLLVDPSFSGTAWSTTSNITVSGGVMTIAPIPKAQLITNPGFESGATGWTLGPTFSVVTGSPFSGTQSLRAAPNPKPQLIANSEFNSVANWTLASQTGIAAGVLFCTPIPYPQLLSNTGFESGSTGWPTSSSGDIGVVNDASKAYAGSWALRIGPITQKQVLYNGTFENGLTGWTQVDGAWYQDPGGGQAGSNAATTQGVLGNPMSKILQYDSDWATGPGGTFPVAVLPGESYRFEALVRMAASTTDGWAYISCHIPHPTVANKEKWYTSKDLHGATPTSAGAATDRWYDLHIDVPIPTNRFAMDCLLQVRDQTTGYIAFDEVYCYRTRGNRDIVGSFSYTVVPGVRYRLSGWVRSGTNHQTGDMRIGVVLSGTGTSETVSIDQGHTDFVWERVTTEFTPRPGYTQATPFASGQDILGDSMYLDDLVLEKVSGNTRRATHTSFAVVANQRYTLAADVLGGAALTRGKLTVGAILSGSGLANKTVSVTSTGTEGELAHLDTSVTPETGYTTCQVYVEFEDIEGDSFYVERVTFTKADGNTDETTHSSFTVLPDQRYLLSAAVGSDPAVTHGEVAVGVRLLGSGLPTELVNVTQGLTKGAWAGVSTEVRVPPGYTVATPVVISTDVEGGYFYIDDIKLTQMDNNTDSSTGTTFAVTPERTYRWEETVTSGVGLQRGTVKLSARCIRSGSPDVIFDSSPAEATLGAAKRLVFEFTPPSGYDQVSPRIIGTDVEGANWTIDDGDLRDTDTGTAVFDATSTNPAGTSFFVDSTAPAGAEFVRVQMVAESGSTPWTVPAGSLARTGVTPATGNAIVAELLAGMSVTAGTVTAPAVIPYDWHILNLTRRQALDHLCSVVADPPLEYRVNADRSVTVGPATTVFTDHSPSSATPVVLLPEDIDVAELPDAEADVEDRATEIKVVGATRKTVSGKDILISATAAVPGAVETDWNGTTITRTKIISDATVDHFGYAQALADDLAAKEAEPALSLNATLNEMDAATAATLGVPVRPSFGVGSWIYVYKPEAGLEDAAYATTIEGQTVFPRKVRVLSRTRQLGPRYSLELRRTDGTTFVPAGVNWSDQDATTLVIGDRLAEWQSDPQAHKEGVAYLRDRASSPR